MDLEFLELEIDEVDETNATQEQSKLDIQLITQLALLVEGDLSNQEIIRLLEKNLSHYKQLSPNLVLLRYNNGHDLIIQVVDGLFNIATSYSKLFENREHERTRLSYDRVLYYLQKLCRIKDNSDSWITVLNRP